jgi:ribosomal protein S18 acetylase RimI-like enzyme
MDAIHTNVVVRPAVPADLPGLIALDAEVRTATDQPTHAAGWLEPDAATWLHDWVAAGVCAAAEVNGQLAGYGVLHYHFFHSGIIDMVIVGRRHRRCGVGRALLGHLAAGCTSPKVWCSTNLSNTPMQALLAAERFSMCGFIEGLDEGDPELVYSKPAARSAGR